jgi:predicted ATPase
LRYFCSPHHQDSPLHPIVARLERAAGFTRDDAPGMKLGKLTALLAPATPTEEDVALLADLLSIQLTDRHPPLNFSPKRKKEKTLEALFRQLEGLARRRPVLMIFEDVHWIDPTSREVLDFTIEQARRLPILLLVTFRSEFSPPWTGLPHVTMLTLNRLDRRDGLALVERITGTRTVLPRDVVEVIVERTDGVPLFLEELTKTVLEGGGASDRNSREGAPPSPSVQIGIPPTLHASLMARLDRLGSAAKEAAQIGAAIGREFTYELLAAVSPRRELECGTALELLVGSGLVFQRGVPPQASYLFKHALVQDAAYGALLRGARKSLHAHIAKTLESRFPETVEREPALLAHHCAEAGLIEKAVEYFGKAGKQAIARSAMGPEAVAMLRKALALLDGLSDGPVRWRHELALRAALGVALIAVEGYSASETGEVYARARVLCDRLGDMRALIRVASGQFLFHLVRGDMFAARGTAEDLFKAAEGVDAPEAEVTAHQLMGTALFHQGQLTAARTHLDRAVALEAAGRRDEVAAGRVGADPRIPGVAVPAYLALTLCLQGRYSDARAQSDFALAGARRSRRLHRLAFAVGSRGWLNQLLREDTARQIEELAVLAKEQGFPYWTAVVTLYRAVAAAHRGEQSEAAPLFEGGVRALRAIGTISVVPWWAALVAPVLDASYAETLLAEQLRQVETTDERWCEADIYRVCGEIARRRGDPRMAEAYLREAVAIALRQEARHWELRAAISLARLWRDQGRRAEARDLLAPIYGWFTEGFDTPDLKEAKALLEELA